MTARTRTLLSRLSIVGAGALALVLAFAATSFAAGAVDPSDSSPLDLLDPVLQAFRDGRYVYAGSLALVLAVAVARKWGGDRVPWFHTRQGSMTLVMLGSFGATLAARLTGGVELTRAIAWDGVCVGVGAAGGYAAVDALVIDPLVRPLVAKFPRYAAPLKLLLMIFDVGKSDPDPDPPAPPTPPTPPSV